MKHLITLLFLCLTINVSAQDYTVSGKIYTEVKDSIRYESFEIITDCTWIDKKGTQYNIFLSKNGRAYIKKISSKTSKVYKVYLPEKIARDLCKKYKITYNENPTKL